MIAEIIIKNNLNNLMMLTILHFSQISEIDS